MVSRWFIAQCSRVFGQKANCSGSIIVLTTVHRWLRMSLAMVFIR